MTGRGLDHYADPDVVRRYEVERFSGVLGRNRRRAEQRALFRLFDLLPAACSILDCPVGNGRWADELVRRGHRLVGADLSAAMLTAAGKRLGNRPERAFGPALLRGDARHLPLADRSVDVVFSHALTKHLPLVEQEEVFSELVRVSRDVVLCSFSVLDGLRGMGWRLRRQPDAHGGSTRWIEGIASRNGMRLVASAPCSTTVGVERAMLFRRG